MNKKSIIIILLMVFTSLLTYAQQSKERSTLCTYKKDKASSHVDFLLKDWKAKEDIYFDNRFRPRILKREPKGIAVIPENMNEEFKKRVEEKISNISEVNIYEDNANNFSQGIIITFNDKLSVKQKENILKIVGKIKAIQYLLPLYKHGDFTKILTGRIVLIFKRNVRKEDKKNLVKSYGLKVEKTNYNDEFYYVFLRKARTKTHLKFIRDIAKKHKNILWAIEPNFIEIPTYILF